MDRAEAPLRVLAPDCDAEPPPHDPLALPHAAAAERVVRALGTSREGLSEAQAAERLAQHGANRLPQAPPLPLWRVVLDQFRNPLIYVLALAAVVSVAIGEVTDAGFILAVLCLNALIGTIQEWRAEQSSRALQQMLHGRATVVRSGATVDLDAEHVVPGDVVWLESGNRVAADLRLLDDHGLEIDEALLTGESLPVHKASAWLGAATTALADRKNMAFAGSIVARGRGLGVVVATGTHTSVGRLARDVTTAIAGTPPLLVRIERFTRVVGIAVLLAALLVIAIGVGLRGEGLGAMFLFAVAMAVAAIPEGLPVAMTVALSVASRRMARRGAIVRRLAAVEGLGSCTLIATDKTGTLTCNAMTVRRVVLADGRSLEVTGEGYGADDGAVEARDSLDAAGADLLSRMALAAVLCNEGHLARQETGGWTWRGDPTDVALLAFGHKVGVQRELMLERHPELDTIPFEAEHRFAASFHRGDGEETHIFVKGAPERVLAMCAPSDSAAVAAMLEHSRALAAEGFRVLALATGRLARVLERDEAPDAPSGLELLGLVAMLDPLRPGVREAVVACRRAGVQVTMVTGDHPVTALAIARELGLTDDPDAVVSGADLNAADPAALDALIDRVRVFARVSPQQKLQIVEAARRVGHFVAVTGDGVNDAPALRAANIGVAMGRSGTDVAREAAELVLSDDDFSTIVAGIEEGRVAYDNVRKVIYLLISTGAAEVILVLLALATASPLPLLPVQLLWLNLVTNGIQDVALAFEPGERGVLARPPRSPTERIFDRPMIERTLISALFMGAVGFAAFRWMLGTGMAEADARNAVLLLMVLFENVHIGDCRSETQSMLTLSPLRSPILLTGTLAALAIHVLAMHLGPLQRVLSTAPLSLEMWVALGATALTLAAVMELQKLTWRIRLRRRGRTPPVHGGAAPAAGPDLRA